MGMFEDVLAWVDNKRRVAGRNVSDLWNDPRGSMQQIDSSAANYNANVQPVAQGGQLYNRPMTEEEIQQKHTDMAMNFAFPGTFIGKGAKTWDAVAMSRAQQMARDGADPRAIWKETGTWQGPDGHWRQEVSDHESKIVGPLASAIERDRAGFKGSGQLGDFLENPGVYEAYPRLKTQSTEVDVGKFKNGKSDAGIRLRGEMYRDHPRSTALHEGQHVIQDIEGFNAGGNIGTRYSDLFRFPVNSPSGYIADEILRARARGITPTLDTLQSKYVKVNDMNRRVFDDLNSLPDKELERFLKDPVVARGRDGYLRLGGEVEARATEARRNMDAAQRRATFPADSYDVPLDKLIHRRQEFNIFKDTTAEAPLFRDTTR